MDSSKIEQNSKKRTEHRNDEIRQLLEEQTMSTIHNGSNFDDFLQEEGLLADVEATAIKRVVAYQIELEMQKSKLSKTALAQKMHTSRSALDRLLDPDNVSVTLQTLERAALALGKRLKVELA